MRTAAFIVCLLLTVTLCYGHAARLQSLKYRKLSLIADGRDKPVLALAAALKGLQSNPYHVRLHGYAAHALMNLKEYQPALTHLETMLKYYPYELNALFNAAFAYFYTGGLEKAFKMRDRIQRIKPSYIKR